MLALVLGVTVMAAAESWIGLAGGIVATVVSAAVAIRQSRHSARTQVDLARLNSELQSEVQARTALLERDLRAEDVLTKYREPLAAAAYDLQSRLYNILNMRFFARFGGDHERSDLAEETTLFRIAQYFGWTELLRRDIQFLSFPEEQATRQVIGLQSAITQRFATSGKGEQLMIWADEQRAIGERMIVIEHDRVLCAGYARFHDEYTERYAPWCERLRGELHATASGDRLRDVQHLLCELVETLDARRVRYTQNLQRA